MKKHGRTLGLVVIPKQSLKQQELYSHNREMLSGDCIYKPNVLRKPSCVGVGALTRREGVIMLPKDMGTVKANSIQSTTSANQTQPTQLKRSSKMKALIIILLLSMTTNLAYAAKFEIEVPDQEFERILAAYSRLRVNQTETDKQVVERTLLEQIHRTVRVNEDAEAQEEFRKNYKPISVVKGGK